MRIGLLGLVGQGLRQFLVLERGLLMNVGRLLMRLTCGLVSLLVELIDYLLLIGVILPRLVHLWGLCKSQRLGLYNLCIHSFSIIDVL